MTQPTPKRNFTQTPSHVCHECRGRLVDGAEHCLHCGTLIDSARQAKREERRKNGLMTTLMGVFVALGTIGVVGMAVNQYVLEPMNSVVEFTGENSRSVQKACISDSDENQAAQKRRAGWTEVAAAPGQRCFER